MEVNVSAGIVFYRRSGNSLVGQWSHEDTGGALANEVIRDVPPDTLEGDWPVEISAPDGTNYFSGRVKLTKFGSCLSLVWEGAFVASGKLARFDGIGYAIDADSLCATFEQSDISSSAR
jgi:hypothetical protein